VNPVSDDPRYVEVGRGECGSGGHVYAVLEPSLYEWRVKDIKVGCVLMVATVVDWTPKENVSYDEIRGVISEGIRLSWLPVICEDRCGRGTDCKVINESKGEVECEKKHYCHYAYQTTDKCGIIHFLYPFISYY